MSDKKKPEITEPRIRKVRFLRRTAEAEPCLEFSFGRKNRILDFSLVEGNIYELPEDVIQHLNSIKKTFIRSDARTGEVTTYNVNYYYCEPIVD